MVSHNVIISSALLTPSLVHSFIFDLLAAPKIHNLQEKDRPLTNFSDDNQNRLGNQE